MSPLCDRIFNACKFCLVCHKSVQVQVHVYLQGFMGISSNRKSLVWPRRNRELIGKSTLYLRDQNMVDDWTRSWIDQSIYFIDIKNVYELRKYITHVISIFLFHYSNIHSQIVRRQRDKPWPGNLLSAAKRFNFKLYLVYDDLELVSMFLVCLDVGGNGSSGVGGDRRLMWILLPRKIINVTVLHNAHCVY